MCVNSVYSTYHYVSMLWMWLLIQTSKGNGIDKNTARVFTTRTISEPYKEGRMISIITHIVAFFCGGLFGFFIAALCVAAGRHNE